MLRAIRSTLSGPRPNANGSSNTRANHSNTVGAGEYQAVATSIGDELDDDQADLRGQHDKKVYLCFWALGAGVLMSWNGLICTLPLLGSFFPPESAIKGTLASYLSTAYCFGNLFFLGLAQRSVGKTSPSKRLHYALLLLLATSLVLTFPLLPLILPRLSPTFLFPTLIAITITLSLSTAYLQSAVFALASLWGSDEMIAVMSGQGGIAVLVSGVQWLLAILSATTSSEGRRPGNGSEDGSAQSASTLAGVGLWALGSAGTLLCVFAHRYLVLHPGYQAVIASVLNRETEEGIGADVGRIVSADNSSAASGISRDMGTKSGGTGSNLTKKVFMKNLSLEFAVAWVFVVTLSVFPPVTTTILSTHIPTPRLLQPDVFIPLHFLLFNIGDYTGRTYLPSIPSLLITSPPRVVLLSALRTLFIPLLFLCNVSTSKSVPVINSDILYLTVIVLFGLTNGYISSLCMIVASSPHLNAKLDEDERDVAGTLASFCLVAGLAGGSLASFGTSWFMSRA
ncbi:hypothetical protein IAU59_005662 [Kwoniella sp. CBS 9459]